MKQFLKKMIMMLLMSSTAQIYSMWSSWSDLYSASAGFVQNASDYVQQNPAAIASVAGLCMYAATSGQDISNGVSGISDCIRRNPVTTGLVVAGVIGAMYGSDLYSYYFSQPDVTLRRVDRFYKAMEQKATVFNEDPLDSDEYSDEESQYYTGDTGVMREIDEEVEYLRSRRQAAQERQVQQFLHPDRIEYDQEGEEDAQWETDTVVGNDIEDEDEDGRKHDFESSDEKFDSGLVQ